MNLVLFGFKGAGKTTIGRHMAQKMGWAFIDLDEQIPIAPYHSLRELYQAIGETEFRKKEVCALRSIQSVTHTVIALGGGTILDPDNLVFAQSLGKLMYVAVRLETLKNRGIALAAGNLEDVYHRRWPIYESIPAERIQSEHYGLK
jgi:shikimate kinase